MLKTQFRTSFNYHLFQYKDFVLVEVDFYVYVYVCVYIIM